MLMVVDMVMMTTYYIDNDQDHHEDIRAYYILSLPGFGSSCTNTWTDLCPSGPTDEWTRQRFWENWVDDDGRAASFVVEVPLGCLDDRCGHFDHNTITEDISLSWDAWSADFMSVMSWWQLLPMSFCGLRPLGWSEDQLTSCPLWSPGPLLGCFHNRCACFDRPLPIITPYTVGYISVLSPLYLKTYFASRCLLSCGQDSHL